MTLRNLLIAGAAAVSALTVASAASAQTVTAPASANIVTAVVATLDANTSMDFGSVQASAAGGTVTLTPTQTGHTRSATGVTLVGGATAGDIPEFTISTPANTTILLSAANFNLTGPNNTTLAVVPSAPASVQTDATGEAKFKVGGAMTIPANAPVGAYTGQLSVLMTYN